MKSQRNETQPKKRKKEKNGQLKKIDSKNPKCSNT